MSNVKKPEPLGWLIKHRLFCGEFTSDKSVALHWQQVADAEVTPLFSEAYAAEREQKTVDSIIDVIGDCHIDNHQFTEITERIRALIPKQ